MARTVITLASNSAVDSNTDVSRTALIAGATGTGAGYFVAGQTRDERFGLVIENTGSATGIVWVKASDTYTSAGVGDLACTVGGGVTSLIGPLDGARFKQATGTWHIDSGITGWAAAVQI
jgi:hypothetical protein